MSGGARIERLRTQWTPTSSWITWESPVEITAAPITPLPKKARLKGGQTTLTQFETDPAFKPSSGNGQGQSQENSEESPSTSSDDNSSAHKIVHNDVLAAFMDELQENLLVLMEQIEAAYPWFKEEYAFPQKDWIETELSKAILAIRNAQAVVSVMGLRDMQLFLNGVNNRHTYILMKQLSVYHHFHILMDIDQVGVCVVFKILHGKRQCGTSGFPYGTEETIDDDVFYIKE